MFWGASESRSTDDSMRANLVATVGLTLLVRARGKYIGIREQLGGYRQTRRKR